MKWTNQSIERLKDLIVELTKKEMKVRYKRSYLGYLWSVMNPLTLALIFFFAFKVVMKVGIEDYPLFLISGLFPWQFLSNSVNTGVMAFVSNASLIKKTSFPREAIIYSIILSELIHFILSLPVIVVFLLIYGGFPTWWWLPGLAVLIVAQSLLISGIALAVASVNLFFRDLERIINILLNLLFYATPIVYSMRIMPEGTGKMMLLNPFAPLILSYQQLFLEGTLNMEYSAIAALWGISFFVCGRLVYAKLEWRLAEAL